MSTLDYILHKFDLSFNDRTRMPIEIPNVGRNTLAQWLYELDFKTGVEVGVATGEYSEILCIANPQMKLFGIDPFRPYRGYNDYTRPVTFSKLYENAHRRLAARLNYEFIKEFSADALRRFEDNFLDFVYIDANHQEPFITQDITEWYKKLRPGGILAGHDYARTKARHDTPLNHQVKAAVQAYTSRYDIRPWFILGREADNEGLIRDKPRSWMWIKT